MVLDAARTPTKTANALPPVAISIAPPPVLGYSEVKIAENVIAVIPTESVL